MKSGLNILLSTSMVSAACIPSHRGHNTATGRPHTHTPIRALNNHLNCIDHSSTSRFTMAPDPMREPWDSHNHRIDKLDFDDLYANAPSQRAAQSVGRAGGRARKTLSSKQDVAHTHLSDSSFKLPKLNHHQVEEVVVNANQLKIRIEQELSMLDLSYELITDLGSRPLYIVEKLTPSHIEAVQGIFGDIRPNSIQRPTRTTNPSHLLLTQCPMVSPWEGSHRVPRDEEKIIKEGPWRRIAQLTIKERDSVRPWLVFVNKNALGKVAKTVRRSIQQKMIGLNPSESSIPRSNWNDLSREQKSASIEQVLTAEGHRFRKLITKSAQTYYIVENPSSKLRPSRPLMELIDLTGGVLCSHPNIADIQCYLALKSSEVNLITLSTSDVHHAESCIRFGLNDLMRHKKLEHFFDETGITIHYFDDSRSYWHGKARESVATVAELLYGDLPGTVMTDNLGQIRIPFAFATSETGKHFVKRLNEIADNPARYGEDPSHPLWSKNPSFPLYLDGSTRYNFGMDLDYYTSIRSITDTIMRVYQYAVNRT